MVEPSDINLCDGLGCFMGVNLFEEENKMEIWSHDKHHSAEGGGFAPSLSSWTL